MLRTIFMAVICAVFLVGCNAAMIAGSVAKMGYTASKEREEFTGLPVIKTQTPQQAINRLEGQKLYSAYPATVGGKNYSIMLTGTGEQGCDYAAFIPKNKEITAEYSSVEHYKLCGDALSSLDPVQENFPVSKRDKDALMKTHLKSWESGSGGFALYHESELHIMEFIYSRNIASECAESIISVVRGVRLVEHTSVTTCRDEIEQHLASN